jgi:CheY-like chemotaxis protein
MSHERRTPLNSILILGPQLADNPQSNLSDTQVEYARTIHSAGTDLLTLSNDILDRSKIESGTVTVEVEPVTFASLEEATQRTFHYVAETRRLAFELAFDEALPATITTDAKRLRQILKNLLSNAFKFTPHGQVRMDVTVATEGWTPEHPVLSQADGVVAFSVSDTGIGIAPEKQRLIFEAFHQADAGTSRRFGGTGLGLAISRELATLLGAEIRLVSAPGQGSTFTLYLPMTYIGSARPPRAGDAASQHTAALPATVIAEAPEEIQDDRASIAEGDSSMLIVDDDPYYARLLLDMARDHGFKALVAHTGQAGIELAKQYGPTAITLDVFLPDMLGWTVLNHLKLDLDTRHIPVQMLSVEEERQHGLSHGAFSYLVKPATKAELDAAFERLRKYVTPHPKRLLVVEEDDVERQRVVDLLAHDDIEITECRSGSEAMNLLSDRIFDCCVIELRLPDMSGVELLEKIQSDEHLRDIPCVVYTDNDLSDVEAEKLHALAKSIILKDVRSPERLFDETSLFLHRSLAALPSSKRDLLSRLHASNEQLRGKKVLVVDDDVRNIFALTTVLENQDIEVLTATSGRAAIEAVQGTAGINAVLMDIMMPDMDGYATMRGIRDHPRHRYLPILALTAKAMKGDREKCLQAGASDYIAKPVDTTQLLSMLRVWLHR